MVTVIGAGLAGCEAAWQLAQRGIPVTLREMKPQKSTPAHHSADFAELVCSNSLRGAGLENAPGLLKEELRRLGSLILQAADATRVEAGGALAVDRSRFAGYVTAAVRAHRRITVAEGEVDIPMCQVKLLNIVNVHDCGKLINPALAEAQVHGGMSMGIGYGLSEQLLFDEKSGKPLNNNLLDYKLSTFMDHPNLQALFVENPEPTSPYGTKALGEPPACSPAPAIRNAVLNATGVAVNDAPMTPHILFREFTKAGLI